MTNEETAAGPLDGFTTSIEVKAGYDYRDDPNDQRGGHGAELHLILTGPLGVIVARIGTGWMLNPIAGPYRRDGKNLRSSKPGIDDGLTGVYPTGSMVTAHSPAPREHWDEAGGPCPYTGASHCWTMRGYLLADELLAKLIAGGDRAAFAFMAEIYTAWFAAKAVPAEPEAAGSPS